MKVYFILSGCFFFVLLGNYLLKRNRNIKIKEMDIYQWMNMESKKRRQFDQLENRKVMEHKSRLINKTRKEYIKHKESLTK